MEKVRLGVIGAGGGMAGAHQDYFKGIDGLDYTAASELSEEKRNEIVEKHGVQGFADASEMIRSGLIDAVLIACPHFAHPRYAMEAFDAGVHVLCEKPIAVTAKEAQEVIEAYEKAQAKHPGLIFAGMFNQRTSPAWKEIKRLCSDGSLGELVRVSWTITSWFRTQAYYDSGGWRATWAGEGGGVLINQCPHNLDLLQWFVGMPAKVSANVSLGKYHHIEVEDDVTALLEFPNGATGTFITSTGQSPGINRLEIVGDNGTIVADEREGGKVVFLRADQPVSDFTQTSKERFGDVPCSEVTIVPAKAPYGQHESITRNFIETILDGSGQDGLIAPGTEMIHGLELGNAMLMAGLKNQSVNLPTDREAFDQLLSELQANSTFKKNETVKTNAAMGNSF
ncbi:Gfo/Idh/MocA family protein [Algisphaera agarilytica]|uniref:Putative dehydrogenase n=1 Tax=Algisphaera agarilytica TaxID=1385975 RepID=A0A7X0H7I3_9BACT|nr:Gfo/Idh/MocA family oxidoreductase [Algisphaera agarilytica]MBB6430722.1 putative dehydrogenase [Algisphaera agarilytica]